MNVIADQGVRRGRKFDQVLDGARKVFLRDGFERASVDDIAREAGVSKATIYAYFPDKQLLFMEALTVAAERIIAFLMSEFGQRMFRIVVGEGQRFPGLGREFHDCGPGLIHERLVHHLGAYVDSGLLSIDDLDLAADQFAQLCKAGIHERLIFGMAETVTPDEVHRIVHGAVDMFLARYGARTLPAG